MRQSELEKLVKQAMQTHTGRAQSTAHSENPVVKLIHTESKAKADAFQAVLYAIHDSAILLKIEAQ